MTNIVYSIEVTNESTGEVKVTSFDTEAERSAFIEKIPDGFDWWIFETKDLFGRKCLNWELAGLI